MRSRCDGCAHRQSRTMIRGCTGADRAVHCGAATAPDRGARAATTTSIAPSPASIAAAGRIVGALGDPTALEENPGDQGHQDTDSYPSPPSAHPIALQLGGQQVDPAATTTPSRPTPMRILQVLLANSRTSTSCHRIGLTQRFAMSRSPATLNSKPTLSISILITCGSTLSPASCHLVMTEPVQGCGS